MTMLSFRDFEAKLDALPVVAKQDVLTVLKEVALWGDIEAAHCVVDKALLRLINDPEITKAYDSFEKWYA